MKPIITNTEEQEAFIQAVADHRENIVLEAVAGAGKTGTILRGLPRWPGKNTILAFNKRIAAEIKGRLTGGAAMRTDVRTVHSAGFAAYKLHTKQEPPKPDGDKVLDLAGGPKRKGSFAIAQLVSMAKQHGMGVTGVTAPSWQDLIDHYGIAVTGTESSFIDWAEETLLASNHCGRDRIDYDDMIYLPLLWQFPFPKADRVIIDEAQDTNPMRLELAIRMLKPDGRLHAVGDNKQSIFGFTGADAHALDNIRKRMNSQIMHLTYSFRCPRAVVASVRDQSTLIRPAPGSEEGKVQFLAWDEWRDEVRPGDAVLCRINRPLLIECLRFIRLGIKARIEGRDIGRGLINLTKRRRWHDLDDLEHNIDAIHDAEREKANKLGTRRAEQKFQRMEDQLDTVRVLIGRAREVGATDERRFIAMVEGLFADDVKASDTITFSSVHKSKGLEWDRVFILGRWEYMPFFSAELPWEHEQEDNLIYVAHTRAHKELFLVDKAPGGIRGLRG